MTIVSNASTLVSLSKINELDLLKLLKNEVVIPLYVYEESVIEGKRKNKQDAYIIDKYFVDGTLQKKDVMKKSWDDVKRILSRELNRGDHDVLALAIQLNAKEILTDDDGLSKAAIVLGLTPVSSPDILLKALIKRVISLEKYELLIRSLVLENRLSERIAQLYIIKGGEYIANEK